MFTICSIKGCSNKSYTDICRKHYDQKRHNRGIFRNPLDIKRRPRDPNQFVIEENICKIYLYNKQGIKKAETIIDIVIRTLRRKQ